MRGIVDDLVSDFLDVYFPEAIPMVEKEAYLYDLSSFLEYFTILGVLQTNNS